MKRMAWNLGLVLVVMGLLAGCTSAIYNINNATVAGLNGGTLTMPEIKKAIMTAGAGLGWQVKEESPGHLVGTLHLRTHTAVVDIPYSTETYNITYKSSSNLLYDPEDGTIHSNYNGWIENLDKAIKTQLAAL